MTAERARQLLQRLARLSRAEEGFALVAALGFTVVLSITAASAVTYMQSHRGAVNYTKADQLAQSYAEAALAHAYSTVYSTTDPRDPGAVPTTTVAFEKGTGEYRGTLSGNTWALVGTGRVQNPNHGTDIVRSARGRMTVGSGRRGTANNAIWNYLYADDTSSCTELRNSTTINIPMYVRGDLCLRNTASFDAAAYAVQVGGTVWFRGETHIGAAGGRLHEAHIGLGCRIEDGPLISPCGDSTRIYTELPPDNVTTNLTKPPVDLAYWYANAKPGPMHGCTVGSFPQGFDTDGVLNRPNRDVDLAPDYAYDCQFWENGELVGRIAWSGGSNGTLTIKGTIFIDGNISLRQYLNAVYVGKGTIYASGTVEIRNDTTLCGVAGCGADWKPLENLLALVAGAPSGFGFTIRNHVTFQGAIYAVADYEERNDAVVWGPIIANQLYIRNSTQNFYVPIGTILPGMPATYEDVVVLSNDPAGWG